MGREPADAVQRAHGRGAAATIHDGSYQPARQCPGGYGQRDVSRSRDKVYVGSVLFVFVMKSSHKMENRDILTISSR
jgi:hypothetical protein